VTATMMDARGTRVNTGTSTIRRAPIQPMIAPNTLLMMDFSVAEIPTAWKKQAQAINSAQTEG